MGLIKWLDKRLLVTFYQLTPKQQEKVLKFNRFFEKPWFNLLVGVFFGAMGVHIGNWLT